MTESNDNDYEKVDESLKCLKGVLVDSLRTVLRQVHTNLSAEDDALSRVEAWCIRLLGMLCAKPPPHTIQDIEDRVARTLPELAEQALTEAREIINKSKKKKLVLPFNQIQNLLQKEVLQYKLDNTVSLFLVAVLEYIAAHILYLAGNYALKIPHLTISQEDIRIGLVADLELWNFFCGEKSVPTIPLPTTPRSSLTYEDVVKELINDVKQHQRDLQMIIWVFREELAKCVKDPNELDLIFANIFEIYEFTVTLLGALEDVIEMSQEQTPLCVGSCFEELAEGNEFHIFLRYAEDITLTERIEALQNLVNQQDASKLLSAGHGFRQAAKYYLPKLLLGPIWHAFSYFGYVRSLMELSPSQEDKDVFEQVEGLLSPLETILKKHVAKLSEDSSMQYPHLNGRERRQRSNEKTRELLSSVEHFGDKDANGQSCNEFIREDTLQKLSKRITERKVYLFDSVLILCKQIRGRSVNPNANAFDYRQKERIVMRRVDIIDRIDSDDLKFAFEISIQQNQSIVLIAKSLEHKIGWMADLVMVTTKPMLNRILDSILLDIEKKHPLKLPSPEIYRFAEPDSPDNIVLEEKDSTDASVPLIKGATLCKLIERLTYHIYADPAFVRIFLTTYRSFCTSQELLKLLIERYDIPEANQVYEQTNGADIETDKIHKNSPREDWKRYRQKYVQPVQIRVLNVLRHWVDHHFYDFERDPTLLDDLTVFLETVNGKSMRKWVESVQKILRRKQEQEESHKQITFAYGNSPPAIEHHLEVDLDINLLTLHPLELARQLTILEFELYKTVKPSELVGSVWTKRDKETSSPNLLRMIKHTTNFTHWIEKSILEAENFEERVAMQSRAIEVMIVLSELNNFNGVLSVVAAFDSAAVHRLKFTLKSLPERHRNFLDECRELNKDHFRRYREKLRSINPPCVPFLGIYLTNILHIEEGNKDEIPKTELINFAKRRKVAEITGEIQQYQNQPYCLKVDPKIRNFLDNLDPFKGMKDADISNFLFQESLRLEPRNSKQPLKFSRKWPDLPLKSPGTKPKRHSHQPSTISMPGTLPFSNKIPLNTNTLCNNKNQNSNNNNVNANANEEHLKLGQSTSSSSSRHDFTVFATVDIQGNSSVLQPMNTSMMSINEFSDTISLNASMTPPELPKRSNSITSLPNNINSMDVKPILSPRNSDTVTSAALRSQPIISPKLLDSVNEERISLTNQAMNHEPPLISPRTDKMNSYQAHGAHQNADAINFNRSPFQNASHRIGGACIKSAIYDDCISSICMYHHPASPKHANIIQTDGQDIEPMPISPHVNVPDAHIFYQPPPLPPRRREKQESEAVRLAQIRQAPDAPELPPRDVSPPPVPPRLNLLQNTTHKLNACNIYNDDNPNEHSLKLPNTSTIMMRRNSALRDGGATNDPIPSTSTSIPLADINSTKKYAPNISSAPPINRKTSSNTSPNFSPGETTPKLPPKPKSSSQKDRTTMFPYPSV